MTPQEFRPGDRVRHDNDPVGIDEKIVARYDGEGIVFTDGSAVFPQGVRCLTLVSRPVYPEPGQVALAFDAQKTLAALQEFRPGDRVRDPGGREIVVGIDGSQHDDSWARWMDCTIVSRPVYPEPGQVAICIDERLLREYVAWVDDGGASHGYAPSNLLDAILDRAREANR